MDGAGWRERGTAAVRKGGGGSEAFRAQSAISAPSWKGPGPAAIADMPMTTDGRAETETGAWRGQVVVPRDFSNFARRHAPDHRQM